MAKPEHDVRIWGVIPAAGLSRRMGSPKQLLGFKGSTLVGVVTRTLLDADIGGVVVVTRTLLGDALQLPIDSRVRVAINDDADSEMLDSIRIGVRALNQFGPKDDDGVLVVPADMPSVSVQTCRACMAAYACNLGHIVIATHQGSCGHPMVFPFGMRSVVDGLEGGLNMLRRVRPEAVVYVGVDDPGAQDDIDTAEDYRRLGD